MKNSKVFLLLKKIYLKGIYIKGRIGRILRIYQRKGAMIFWRKRNSDSNNQNLLIYDTSIGSNNSGDYIIMDYCEKIISENMSGNIFRHPTHRKKKTNDLPKAFQYEIVCGTNLLYSKMEEQIQWFFPLKFRYLNKLCLLGAGWNKYEDIEVSNYTKKWYYTVLNNGMIHSVRDSYTEHKLKEIGIKNVVNTACPTMWKLTPKWCDEIPKGMGKEVITTVTDYDRNPGKDKFMLETLKELYETVYIWLQGKHDKEYIEQLVDITQYVLVPFPLSEYDKILKNCHGIDYVGTRLHAGIRALNFKRRTIVIGIDNRAVEISNDTKLPVLRRENIEQELREYIVKEFKTEIVLPVENIERWKRQFKK